ncbi:glycosyltransferase [bacterium]|nr:glycosyltransferase [bacterium]
MLVRPNAQGQVDTNQVDIVFVSDMFVEDYVGGAELTTEALIGSCPMRVLKLKPQMIDMNTLQALSNAHWVFGNFATLNHELIPSIVANIKYSVLEYDYKYCKYRSPEKHAIAENKPCDCHNDIHGKMISAFYYGATTLWWMSEAQESKYHSMFPFLAEKNNVVLSSVFDDRFFLDVKLLNDLNKNKERKGWIVLGSNSWIKGADDAEQWCKDNSHDYEVVWDLPYQTVLKKLATAEGFVYLPKGGDTCPRMVIEAKLLGCKLHLNENVQHAKELWFDTEDEFDTLAWLFAARERFWNGIKYDMSYTPPVSGYTTTKDCILQDYPFEASISSMLGFCEEVVVVDGGSTDGTWEKLEQLAKENDKLVVHQQARDWNDKRFAVFDGAQKALARSMCTKKFCWQQDSDEIVHEDDYEKIQNLTRNFPVGVELIALPVVEYWGGPEKVRMDINPWKWRLSRNLPHITHGIPSKLRKFDEEGNLYSAPGSDGCDYVRTDNYEPIQFANFMTADVDNARIAGLNNPEAKNSFELWFNQALTQLPAVQHYSWFNIARKIRTYKNYWSKHWQSLYDISQDDTAENNMFFNKSWSEVTEEELDSQAQKLSDELGGWIFHEKVNFDNPTPHITIDRAHPAVVQEWIDKNK